MCQHAGAGFLGPSQSGLEFVLTSFHAGECRVETDSDRGSQGAKQRFGCPRGPWQSVIWYDRKLIPRQRRRRCVILIHKCIRRRAMSFGTPFTSIPYVTTTSPKPQSGRTRPDWHLSGGTSCFTGLLFFWSLLCLPVCLASALLRARAMRSRRFSSLFSSWSSLSRWSWASPAVGACRNAREPHRTSHSQSRPRRRQQVRKNRWCRRRCFCSGPGPCWFLGH